MSTCMDAAARQLPLPLEEWRPVVGYEGRYEVSSEGRVWSHLTKRILRPGTTSRGYLSVNLSDGSRPKKQKSFCVHSLVAAAFIGPRPDGYEIDHGKLGKLNNSIGNLEYVTPQTNVDRAEVRGLVPHPTGVESQNAKLTSDQVNMLRWVWPRRKRGDVARFSREYKVSERTILSAMRGDTYK